MVSLSVPPAWLSRMRPASFRGVGFFVRTHGFEFGRRNVEAEFIGRDRPYSEDLGRRRDAFRITAYVIGDNYDLQRDALIKATRDSNQVGTLIHPTLGSKRVRCDSGKLAEGDAGGMAVFELMFIEAGDQPAPNATTNTASTLLGTVSSILATVNAAYQEVMAVIDNPALLLPIIGDLLGDAGSSLLGSLSGLVAVGIAAEQLGVSIFAAFSAIVQADIVGQVAAFTYNVSDPVGTSTAVSGAFQTIAQAIVSANSTTTADPSDPVVDPSYGLAALATWGNDLPPVALTTPMRIAEAAYQAAVVSLVQGSAVLAVTALYAQTTWMSANAAQAARDQLVGMIATQAEAAANAGSDALYAAWQTLAAAAYADMTIRAQALPLLGSYTMTDNLPSLVLAQRLYQDPTRADELVALNDVIHPLFMPLSGVCYTS